MTEFVPVILGDEEPDNHLTEHAEQIAKGLLCECAKVSTTESGITVVEERDYFEEVADLLQQWLAEDASEPGSEEDGYDPGGPYL